MTGRPRGVLLLTFGSAVTSADVHGYLRSVRGGREPSAELTSEFARRFDVIGRSPLLEITAAQATALDLALTERHGPGAFVVAVGMLHSEPRVATALAGLHAAGVEEVAAVVLAPQYSPLILSGYHRALEEAAPVVAPGVCVRVAGAWHLERSWIASLAERVDEALQRFDPDARDRVAIVFTAHSLPRPVVERDPSYMEQIHETVAAVARTCGLGAHRWCFAFQSAGHTPEEWLKPDLVDVLADLHGAGADHVLVVPVQFVADHLEVLYDIDVAAADQARAAGMTFHRIEMPNATPRFIAALADVVDRETASLSV